MARTYMVVENAAGAVLRVDFLDYSKAVEDELAGVDGERLLSVFVCRDCTARKTGLWEGMTQRSKAKKLLKLVTAK